MQAGPISYFLGLEFTDEKVTPVFEIRQHKVGGYCVSQENVWTQVEKALEEKTSEYGRPFYVKTIVYWENADLNQSAATEYYYVFTKHIIDHMVWNPDSFSTS